MGRKAKWVWRVLGVDVPDDETDDVEIDEDEDLGNSTALSPEELSDWLSDLIYQVGLLPEASRAPLAARLQEVRNSIGTADPQVLTRALYSIASDGATATTAARLAEAEAASGHVVDAQKLRREWTAAANQARLALGKFVDLLLADAELRADSRYAELETAASSLRVLIPAETGDIDSALEEMDGAETPQQRRDAATRARAALRTYGGQLSAEEDLSTLQDVADKAFGGVPFLTTLRSALENLDASLAREAT